MRLPELITKVNASKCCKGETFNSGLVLLNSFPIGNVDFSVKSTFAMNQEQLSDHFHAVFMV